MRESQPSKSISFLMELIFVLFFFTIASAICVLVLVHAKDKNDQAVYTRNAIIFAESILEQKDTAQMQTYLKHDKFYLDDKGNPTLKPSVYEVTIIKEPSLIHSSLMDCEMSVKVKEKDILTLPFLWRTGGETS